MLVAELSFRIRCCNTVPMPSNIAADGVFWAHPRYQDPFSMGLGDPGRLGTRAERQAPTHRHTDTHARAHTCTAALFCPHPGFWRQRSWADLAHNQVSQDPIN